MVLGKIRGRAPVTEKELEFRQRMGEREPLKIVEYPDGFSVWAFDFDHYNSIGPLMPRDQAEQVASALAK